ncbi:MAG: peptidase MA family metallohydrolase [Myxococcota bacterium]
MKYGSQTIRRVVAALITALVLVYAGPAAAEIPAEQMTVTEVSDGSLRFHHLRQYERGIDTLHEQGPEVFHRVESSLGVEDMPTIDVWVVPRVADYFDLQDSPNRAPEWAVGLSFSDRHTIIVAAGGERPPIEVMRTFAHELAHVGIDVAREGQSVPRWFNEGFSTLMAQEWTPDRSEKLSRAAAGGQLRSFHDLSRSFPAHHQSASLAYDQSFHFVRWLRAEFGDDLYARVFDRIRAGEAFDAALEAETGSSLTRLESRWKTELESSTSVWSILSEDNLIFFGAGVLFLITYVVVRRRRREKLESMTDDSDSDAEWDYDESRYPLPGQSD